MAGTSPPPRPNRSRKRPKGGKYDDSTVLAQALIDEQLRDSSQQRDGSPRERNRLSKPPPGGKYDDPAELAQALIDEQLKERKATDRWRDLWNALKGLFRRSGTADSSSSQRGNGESNPRADDGRRQQSAGQEREQADASPSSQQSQEPSEALKALRSRSPEGVREVATAMWKLIDANPEYQKAYDNGQLPLAARLEHLADRSSSENQQVERPSLQPKRSSEMSTVPWAERVVQTPSADQRFSREAPEAPGAPEAAKAPRLDPSAKAFLDSFMAPANAGSEGAGPGPGDYGDALTAEAMFERGLRQLGELRERSPAPDSPGSSQNPVAGPVGSFLPEHSYGSSIGGEPDVDYHFPPTQSHMPLPQTRGRQKSPGPGR